MPDWYRLCQQLRADGPTVPLGRRLLALLEPLEAVWRQLSTEDRMHLSVIRPLGALLRKQLADADSGEADGDEEGDWATIRKNWTTILREEFEADQGHEVATLLDPRFKSLPFVPEAERGSFHVHLRAQACAHAEVSCAHVWKCMPLLLAT